MWERSPRTPPRDGARSSVRQRRTKTPPGPRKTKIPRKTNKRNFNRRRTGRFGQEPIRPHPRGFF
ncbi:MAG: hypothetical protein E7576_15920 [Ruminococcaceae bacterium]|nr:hypothetical protein [Oscillospiraceae bacterium]